MAAWWEAGNKWAETDAKWGKDEENWAKDTQSTWNEDAYGRGTNQNQSQSQSQPWEAKAEVWTDAWGGNNTWEAGATATAGVVAGPPPGNDAGYAGVETAAADTSAWSTWDTGASASGTADAWQTDANDSWKQPVPNARAFWEMQQWNKDSGTLSKMEEWELEENDRRLFQERLGRNAGVDFALYNAVPVDVSGSKAAHIPVLATFEAIYEQFAECIPDALIHNVRRCEYTNPTPVQKYAIPVGLVGRDVMCCAQTGSGKTAAFLIPVIGRMMLLQGSGVGDLESPFDGPCSPGVLILAPTRELCIQTFEEACKMSHRTSYRTCRIYGGEQPKTQLEDIAKGCDLMVATPGRLQDFVDRGCVNVGKVSILCLDEADRMLDMGFEKQIRSIVENHGMPPKEERQTMMFSATFPEECQRMAQDFLYDYIWIGVGVVGGAVQSVQQKLMQVAPSEKYEKLVEVLDDFFLARKEKERCLVFTNAKDTAKK